MLVCLCVCLFACNIGLDLAGNQIDSESMITFTNLATNNHFFRVLLLHGNQGYSPYVETQALQMAENQISERFRAVPKSIVTVLQRWIHIQSKHGFTTNSSNQGLTTSLDSELNGMEQYVDGYHGNDSQRGTKMNGNRQLQQQQSNVRDIELEALVDMQAKLAAVAYGLQSNGDDGDDDEVDNASSSASASASTEPELDLHSDNVSMSYEGVGDGSGNNNLAAYRQSVTNAQINGESTHHLERQQQQQPPPQPSYHHRYTNNLRESKASSFDENESDKQPDLQNFNTDISLITEDIPIKPLHQSSNRNRYCVNLK